MGTLCYPAASGGGCKCLAHMVQDGSGAGNGFERLRRLRLGGVAWIAERRAVGGEDLCGFGQCRERGIQVGAFVDQQDEVMDAAQWAVV